MGGGGWGGRRRKQNLFIPFTFAGEGARALGAALTPRLCKGGVAYLVENDGCQSSVDLLTTVRVKVDRRVSTQLMTDRLV